MQTIMLHPAQLEMAVDVLERRRPAAAVELESRVKVLNVSQWDVSSPFVVWLALRDELMEQMPQATGRRMKHQRDRMFRLLRLVVGVTNAVERHPAMSGMAMRGNHSDRFYVWEHPERPWTPIPTRGRRFAVIGPKWDTVNGWPITSWDEHGLLPCEDPLRVEETHWRLLGHE